MSENLTPEEFVTPSRDEIPTISRQHVQGLEATDDDSVWIAGGMNHVLIHTVGRRSGNLHKVALPFWVDGDGHRIVVASFAGAPKNPAWFTNLSDRTANPQLLVRVQGATYWSDQQVLDGTDYTDTWAALTAERPFYRDYQANCGRRIPLVRLPETVRVATRG